MDDNDEACLSETDHKSGWNTKRSRAERVAVCCMELFLRDYPKQVVSLVKAKSVPANMREFHSGTVRSEERHPSFMFSSTHGPQVKQRTHAKDVLFRLWNLH